MTALRIFLSFIVFVHCFSYNNNRYSVIFCIYIEFFFIVVLILNCFYPTKNVDPKISRSVLNKHTIDLVLYKYSSCDIRFKLNKCGITKAA